MTGPNQPGPPKDTDPMALHAPWRDEYMQELTAKSKTAGSSAINDFLADYWRHPKRDEANHVIARVGDGPTGGLVLLNRFPYASGHLLAALGDAKPRLRDYSPDQRSALWKLTEIAVELAERTLEPQGVNVGMNQGSAAGAGLPGHLHMHIVPRWGGDVNFMAVVGRVRVIPSALDVMAERYRTTWKTMSRQSPSA